MTLAELTEVFQRWLHLPDPRLLYVVLGAAAANRMEGRPVWLMLIGPPSSGKSEVLQSLLRLPGVFPTATLNEAALLSGTSREKRATDATGGFLREIGESGIIVMKDFTSVISMAREQRRGVLAALREIYDGHWVRRLGVDGGRSLEWKGRVGLLAGCTQAIESAHVVAAAMGERFVSYRCPALSPEDEKMQARRALCREGNGEHMTGALAMAVRGFFEGLGEIMRPSVTTGGIEPLTALAMLAARCRSSVERDSHTREITLVPEPEVSTRLVLSLEGLLVGMIAIGVERSEAWDIIVKAGLDSIPAIRRLVFEVVQDTNEPLSTDTVAQLIHYPRTGTRRALEDLEAHQVVTRTQSYGSKADAWALSDRARELYSTATGPGKAGDSQLSVPDLSVATPS